MNSMKKNSTQMLKLVLLVLIFTGFGHLYSHSQEYKDGILQGTIRIKIKPTRIGQAKYCLFSYRYEKGIPLFAQI